MLSTWYGFKYLAKRTVADKISRDRVFKNAKNKL